MFLIMKIIVPPRKGTKARVVMKIIVIGDKMEIGKGDRRVVGSRVCMQIK